MKNPKQNRGRVLDAVSSWLKLLALIVLCVEAVLIIGLVRGTTDDPLKSLYIPLMLGFFTVIVIGLFFDRYIQAQIPRKLTYSPTDVPIESRKLFLRRSGRCLEIVLAEHIAIVSTSLRREASEKIFQLLQDKIRVHSTVFEYPNPSAMIPVDEKFFGRFSWDEHKITCHELFEIPPDIDQTKWAYWCCMQQLYVEAFAMEHRRPGAEFSTDGLKIFANHLERLSRIAKKMVFTGEPINPSVQFLIVKLDELLSGINYDDKSQSQSNCIVQLETSLSTAHDLLKRLMPRVIPI